MPLRLIVGLGNPGAKYSATRHNAGFWFLDRVAEKFGGSFSKEPKFSSVVTRSKSGELDCWLAKPQTYMNNSGTAVRSIIDYYKIALDEILIAYDDIDLEPGTVRLKRGGGHGGHNGLRDIIDHLGSREFMRLRIGVGHPGHRDLVINSVLSRPNAEDQKLINDAIGKALDAMPLIFASEFEKAMNTLHKSHKPQATSDEEKNCD